MLMLVANLLVMASISALFMGAIMLVSKKAVLDREKLSPFECGFSTMEESRAPLSLRFFLVTLIFLIFDVELILMFPFIIKMSFSVMFPHILIFVAFLVILSFGLFVEWNQMMLEWL